MKEGIDADTTRLREPEDTFKAFMQYLPVAAFIKDMDGRLLFVNKFFCDVFNTKPNAVLGKNIQEMYDNEWGKKLAEGDEDAIKRGSNRTEEVVVMPSGREIIFVVHRFVMTTDQEEKYLGGFGVDVTERRRQEQSRVRLANNVWELLNLSGLFVVALGEDFTVRLCNISLAKFLGYNTPSDVVGESWDKFLPCGTKEILRSVHNGVRKGRAGHKEFTNEIIGSNGKPYIVKWFNARINDELKWSFSIGMA